MVIPSTPTVKEWMAGGAILLILLIVPLWLWWYGSQMPYAQYPPGTKIFNVTGLGDQGRWTLEQVSAYDYWWKTFPRAEIRVDLGDVVVLRLQSGDVTHAFYAPTLGIGPIYIEPGYVEVVTFRAHYPGIHYYYCTSICGDCHYFMRGLIVVGSTTAIDSTFAAITESCPHRLPNPASASVVDRGQYLFRTMGCIACHGEAGRGDIVNPNYARITVPQLSKLFRTLSLGDPDDAEMLANMIADGTYGEEMGALHIGIARQELVLAKHQSVRDVIRKGRIPARADTTSFVPPLSMPAWGEKLTERDIDEILVYLLRNQVWEEE